MKNFLRLAALAGAVAAAPALFATPAGAAPSTTAHIAAQAGPSHGGSKSPACKKSDARRNKAQCADAAAGKDKEPTNVINNTSNDTHKNNSHDTHTSNSHDTHTSNSHDTHRSVSHDTHYSTSHDTQYNKTYNVNYNTTYSTTYNTGSEGVLSDIQELPVLGSLLSR